MELPGEPSSSIAPQLQGRDIVLLASAPWECSGRLNCHHLALRLARHNRVLFVESPGLRTPNLMRGSDLRRGLERLRHWAGSLGRPPLQLQENLFRCSPLRIPLRGVAALERASQGLFVGGVQRAASRLGFEQPLLWTFLPIGAWLIGKLGECAAIYHCADDYGGNPGADREWLGNLEQRLADDVQLAFATSLPLAERLRRQGFDRVETVPNVAETERFEAPDTTAPAPEVERLPGPRIGYVGNLASYKVDLQLLESTARALSRQSFVVIGPIGSGDPDTSVAELEELANVHLLGVQPYEQIPTIVNALDVCLIPFRRSAVTDCSLPLKTFEYLAAGKPVIATPTRALTSEPLEDVVTYASTTDEFVAAIETALREDCEELQEKRREVARQYSWKMRFPQISRLAAEAVLA